MTLETLFSFLINNFSYLGVIVVSAISSASIIFPLPGFAVVFTLGSIMNPLLLGITAGVGAAIGELTGYLIGLGGGKLILKKRAKKIAEIQNMFNKYRGRIVIFIFALTPLPFDIVGIFCGTIKYDLKKFFIALLAGKIIRFIILAYAGFYSINWITNLLGI